MEPDFHVVKNNGLANYQTVAEKMSPELREAFLNACLWSGLSEDDCIHAILAFQAELFDAQNKALMSSLGSALSKLGSGNGQAPDLKQIEDAVTRALQKRRDDVAMLSALDQMPRLVGNHVDKLLQERIEDFRKEITPEKEGDGRRWPAWIRNTVAFISRRSFIAVACLVLGALPFFVLYLQAQRERVNDATSRIVTMMNKLPDSVRLNMTGNITYSPAVEGKPPKVVLNFGEKLRPVTAEITKSNEVSVIFAP
jgi:hypothetical protein